MKKANALYCSLRQRWWKIGLRFIITGAGTPGRPAWTCFVWSHALPIPVFQPSLKLRWVMKAVSVNLSMGLWCVIRVTVCWCCGMSMAVPMANSPTPSLQHNIMQHNYSNHCADTQYQCNKTYNINCIEDYIVHGAPQFGLANRRMQNPEHDCVAKIKEKSACSCLASESNRKRNTWM